MSLEITAKVLRGNDELQKVVGISIIAGAETYSEDFVSRFPAALRTKKATLTVEDGKVVLEGPTFSGSMRKFEFSPTAEELDGLNASIFAQDKKLAFKADGMLSAGFRLVVEA